MAKRQREVSTVRDVMGRSVSEGVPRGPRLVEEMPKILWTGRPFSLVG